MVYTIESNHPFYFRHSAKLLPHIENANTLCDVNSGYGALQCSNKSGGCPGGSDSDCRPYNIWAGTDCSGSKCNVSWIESGVFKSTTINTAIGSGVRCVLDLIPADQLCDRYSGYGALQCQKLSGGCPGSSSNGYGSGNCWAYCFWSSVSGTFYCLNSGAFNPISDTALGATSVRCVLDLKIHYRRGCPGAENNNCNPYRVWGTATAGGHYRGNLNSGSFDTGVPNSALYANGVRCVLDLIFQAKEILDMKTVKKIAKLKSDKVCE